MTPSLLGTMLGYMTACSYTPGPGNILAMDTTTKFVWQQSRRLLSGICCGYLFVQFLCTAAIYGLSHILTPVLSAMKYIGFLYMLWLAFHIIRSRPQAAENIRMPTFRTGFLLQLVNVKIYLYIMTLLTVYLIPHIRGLIPLFAAGVCVVLFGSAACLVWAALGVQLQNVYTRHYKAINLIFGLFLLYCAWGIIRS